jgi:hypothetical protein
VLFTFPSRYWCAIGHRGVLRLGGWSPHVRTGFLVPRPTRGPPCTLTRTGLSPSLARRSRRFRFVHEGHWPGPRSLATTCGVASCFPFLRLLRWFSSPGSPPSAMDSPKNTPKGVGCPIRTSEDHRALAPPLGFSQRATSFIASRYQGIHQMPFSCCVRAQPRARKIRGQTTENIPADLLAPSGPLRQRQPRPMHRASAARIPMLQARPHLLRDDGRTCFTRSRLASRFQQNTRTKAAPTDRTVRRARLAHDPRSRCQRTRQGTSRPPLCVLRHPSSPTPVGGLAHACWWAWADLNGRPHAYQACALTS